MNKKWLFLSRWVHLGLFVYTQKGNRMKNNSDFETLTTIASSLGILWIFNSSLNYENVSHEALSGNFKKHITLKILKLSKIHVLFVCLLDPGKGNINSLQTLHEECTQTDWEEQQSCFEQNSPLNKDIQKITYKLFFKYGKRQIVSLICNDIIRCLFCWGGTTAR